jgi:hypothetical protein
VQEMVREEEEYLQKERALAEKTPKKEVADKVGEAGSVNDDEDVTDLVSILPLMPLRSSTSHSTVLNNTKRYKLIINYDVDIRETSGSLFTYGVQVTRYNCVFDCTGDFLKLNDFFVQMINVDDIKFQYKKDVDDTIIFDKTYRWKNMLHAMPAPTVTEIPYDKDKLTSKLKREGNNSMSLPWDLRVSEIECAPRNAIITYSLFEKTKGAITVQTKFNSFLENNMRVRLI